MSYLVAWFSMSYTQAARTTLVEYEIYSKAQQKKMEQNNRNLALQAWLNVAAQATKKNGKSVYRNFEDFYSKNFKTEATPAQEKRKLSMAERNRRMNKRRKEVSNGR